METPNISHNENLFFEKRILSMIKMATCAEIWRCKHDGYSRAETAKELNLNRRTVTKYWDMRPEDIEPIKRKRLSLYAPIAAEVEALFRTHRNSEVVLDELRKRGHATTKVRALQQYLRPVRDQLNKKRKEAQKARRRVESSPGQYMQIDFGERDVVIGGKSQRLHFFVAVLAYSRKRYVAWFNSQDSDAWLRGIEGAFARFGGTPKYIVCDNARALVTKAAKPSRSSYRHFVANERFDQFCQYWGVTPTACMPYYPQSKGKVENAVAYVKKSCLAGFEFDDEHQLQQRLDYWMDEIADKKELTLPTGDKGTPAQRFEVEKEHLLPMTKPSFLRWRQVRRTVDAKGVLVINNLRYQMPLELCKKEVDVMIEDSIITVRYKGKVVTELNETLSALKVTTIAPVGAGQVPSFGAITEDYLLGALSDNKLDATIALPEDYLTEYNAHKQNDLAPDLKVFTEFLGEAL